MFQDALGGRGDRALPYAAAPVFDDGGAFGVEQALGYVEAHRPDAEW